jgi:phosphoglycerate dehydrogenase-like enzyme
MLDKAAFASARPGLHLVNVARGSLVDQEALRAALDDGRVTLASLDVVDPEPLPAGHWLFSDPRVRVSAHVAWSKRHAPSEMLDAFADNLRRWIAGEPLHGVVDVKAGY